MRQREQHVQRPQDKLPHPGFKKINEGQRSSSKTSSGLPTASESSGGWELPLEIIHRKLLRTQRVSRTWWAPHRCQQSRIRSGTC